MSGIYAVSEWIMRFSVINILWIIFNLPIAFILISILFAEHLTDIYYLVPILVVLVPILFFPATQAMFASVRDWVIKRDEGGLIKSYWRYYKDNYKKSVISGVILTFIWLFWYVDVYYFSKENVLLMFVFGFLGIVLFIYTINFFSINAHYHMKLGKTFKNTLLITIGSPVLFFAVLITSAILLMISITKMQFLILFFTGSLMAYISFSAFYRLYLKLAGTH
ncbi:DUF624 domain-containing protein [Oceanobacillus halophilus]|uniref:DUF624 domain-containing protein n=2 Tax=Oceanobacillus halophilus TaxID=930130 RepID=A0A495A821_9BACI|nr:DUF624 domain-containing protein [Oceanobacillus halophilus]